MNSTELPQRVQDAIVIFHHVSGAIFFLVNSLVIFLILIDVDSRGKAYRKYILPLQASSTLLDLFCNGYTPIIQVNCRALYSDSRLAQHVDIVTFITVEIFLFVEVASSYFACVYYRRNVVLLPGSRFCYRGWRRILIFISLQICTFVICTIVHLFAKNLKDDTETLPLSVQWLSRKVAFILFRESPLIYVAGAMAICYGLLIVFLVAAMLLQMLLELKNGMHHASISTKKYQKRAVVSILLQGLVPSMVYIIPIIGELLIYLQTLVMGLDGAANDLFVSTISALLLSVITTHTFVHSLTIISCSPSYRRTLRNLLRSIMRKFGCSKNTVQPTRYKFSVHISHFTMYPYNGTE